MLINRCEDQLNSGFKDYGFSPTSDALKVYYIEEDIS